MKKWINIFLTSVMLLNLLIPIKIYAITATEKMYEYNTYTVKYEIVNEWENNQNVKITLTNTSEDEIVGWAVGFDSTGEINDLWNGVVYKNNRANYIIKNAGYNYVIEPDSSVEFGYTLTGENLDFPDKIEIYSERTEKADGYTVEFTETSSWENGFQGLISITNLSELPIEAWTLVFDSNFVIEDLWDAKLISKTENTYEIASQQWTNPIQPNSTITFGFRAGFDTTEIIAIDNLKITEIVIDEDSITENPNIETDEEDDGIYFKSITSKDEVIWKNEDIGYVHNQLIIMVNDSVSFEKMTEFVKEMNAEIVGFIDITNEYQVELKTNIDQFDLNSMVSELQQYQFVEYVSLNYVIKKQYNSEKNETFPNDKYLFLDQGVTEENWNLYAINVFDAWKYYNKMEPVNIGIIDSGFFENHPDLDFKKVWNNENKNLLSQWHGTFVAGIMAAEFNNTDGLAGICPKKNLYGYATLSELAGDNEYENSMLIKSALSQLIKKNVKAINISMSFSSNNKKLLRDGDYNTLKMIEEATTTIEKTLEKMIDKDYDFIIVQAAGNDTSDAKYSYYFSYTDNEKIKEHSIIVGAINHKNLIDYYFRTNCNYGNNVDVVAPGMQIVTTDSLHGYTGEDHHDTSAAAPHVSGIAGMMYSVNPEITAPQVKNIIKQTSILRPIRDSANILHGIADAGLAVNTAYYLNKTEKIIYGSLIDSADPSIVYGGIEMEISYPMYNETWTATIESDENGEYEIVIPKDVNIEDLEFEIDGLIVDANECLGEFFESCAVLETKVTPCTTIKGVVTDSNTGDILSDVNIKIHTVEQDGTLTEFMTKTTDEEGKYRFDLTEGTYKVEYVKNGYCVYDYDTNIAKGKTVVERNISLIPIEAAIKGTVTLKDMTTNEVTPKAGHAVMILKDGEEFASTVTSSDGTYSVMIREYGDYTVVFGDEHQRVISINLNTDYEIDCQFEHEGEKDGEDDPNDPDNNNSNNNDDDDNNNDDDPTQDDESETEPDEDVIIISTEVEDPTQNSGDTNTQATGTYNVDMKDGIYIDCGEYTYHYYVADYDYKSAELWTAFHKNLLMYDVYKNGTLIKSRRVCFWYVRVVYSGNYSIWISTEYVNSVGIKIKETDGEYKVYLTYTVRRLTSPNYGSTDRVTEHTVCLTGGSAEKPTVRTSAESEQV